MPWETLQTVITTLGFPIVCCVALGWFVYKMWTTIDAKTEKREEKLYTLIGECQQQNATLSETNAQFVSVLESYKDDLDCIKTDITEIKERIK